MAAEDTGSLLKLEFRSSKTRERKTFGVNKCTSMISSCVLSPYQHVSPGAMHSALSIFLPLFGYLLQMMETCQTLPGKHKRGLQGKNSQKALLQQLFLYPILPSCGSARLRGTLGSAGSAAHPSCSIARVYHAGSLHGVGLATARTQPQRHCAGRYACSSLAPNSNPSNYGYLVYIPACSNTRHPH